MSESNCWIDDIAATEVLILFWVVYLACCLPNQVSFAALRQDGCVVAWGDPCFGGAAVNVQDQLQYVVAIQSTSWAFAALLANGASVSWGEGEDEIPWTAVKQDLTSVTCIAATGGDRLPVTAIRRRL